MMQREGLVLALALPAVASTALVVETRKRPSRLRLGHFQISPKLELRNAYLLTRYVGSMALSLPLDLTGRTSFSWEAAHYLLPVAGGTPGGPPLV
jgi:hypothetical protein